MKKSPRIASSVSLLLLLAACGLPPKIEDCLPRGPGHLVLTPISTPTTRGCDESWGPRAQPQVEWTRSDPDGSTALVLEGQGFRKTPLILRGVAAGTELTGMGDGTAQAITNEACSISASVYMLSTLTCTPETRTLHFKVVISGTPSGSRCGLLVTDASCTIEWDVTVKTSP